MREPMTSRTQKAQALPTAWRPGEVADYIQTDEVFRCGTVVKGTLRGRVTLDEFRIFRGRRAWYVSGKLPTNGGGALVFEDDLWQLDGRKKVDTAFATFIHTACAPGALRKLNGHALDVRKWRPGLAGER